MNKLILILILSVAILAFSQASMVCSSHGDCNDYSTNNNKVCETNADPLLNKCIDRTGLDFKTTTVDPKGKCKDSFDFGTSPNTHICGAFANLGCSIEDSTYTKCIDSIYDFAAKKCVPLPVLRSFVGEGERCDLRSTKDIQCGDNLQCIDKVCRAKLNDGDNCITGSSTLECKNGFTCEADFCRPSVSKWNGQSCKAHFACRSGVCDAGVCLEKRSIPCFSDSQCGLIGFFAEVCYKPSGSLRGTCTQMNVGGAARYMECSRANEQAITAVKPTITACEKSYIEYVCAQNCGLRPDLRFVGTGANEKRGYTYNCQTMTRTAIADNTCAIKEFITGCPATPFAGAIVNGLSVLLFAIIALIFA